MQKNIENVKKIIINFLIINILLVFCVAPTLLYAAEVVPGQPSEIVPGQPNSGPIKIENPFKKDTIRGLIETIVKDILMPIGGVVAVLMIMYAGFLYVTAGGDPGQIKKAHDALLWAVIGAAILLGAWVISEAISKTIDQLRV